MAGATRVPLHHTGTDAPHTASVATTENGTHPMSDRRHIGQRIYDPDRDVELVAIIDGLEVDIWHLHESDEEDEVRLGKTKHHTRYDELREDEARTRRHIEDLNAAESEWLNAAADDARRGGPRRTRDSDFDAERQVLERALAAIRTDLADPQIIQEHVEDAERRLAAQLRDLDEDLRPAADAAESASSAAVEAQERLERAKWDQTPKREQIAQQRAAVRSLIAHLDAETYREPGAPDQPVDLDRYEGLLQEFRSGTRTTVISGMDPTEDAAFEQYRRDVRDIVEHARRAGVQKRITGKTPAPPACATHYSRDRIAAIVGNAERSSGNGARSTAGRSTVTF